MNKKFPIVTLVGLPSIAPDLTSSDREKLLTRIKFSPDLLPILHNNSAVDTSVFLNPKPQTTLQELVDGYSEIETKSDLILDILCSRAEKANLNMPIDPINQPDVAIAAYSLFGGKPDFVTFEMYRKLLDYQVDLGRALAQVG